MQEYNKTDQQLHLLTQIIAKANRTFVPKKEDDSHTNLSYDELGDRILGHWINTDNGDIIVGLNLSSLSIEVISSSNQSLSSTSTIGKTISTIEGEVAEALQSVGLDINGFTNDLHFEIPDYSIAKDEMAAISVASLEEWRQIRSLANQQNQFVLDFLAQHGEIRIWPHHFDTGIYVTPTERLGIGFGLAMGDSMEPSPYLYTSGYGLKGEFQYTDLPTLEHGRWEIGEHWRGAVLPISAILNMNAEDAQKVINAYAKSSLSWYLQR